MWICQLEKRDIGKRGDNCVYMLDIILKKIKQRNPFGKIVKFARELYT